MYYNVRLLLQVYTLKYTTVETVLVIIIFALTFPYVMSRLHVYMYSTSTESQCCFLIDVEITKGRSDVI